MDTLGGRYLVAWDQNDLGMSPRQFWTWLRDDHDSF